MSCFLYFVTKLVLRSFLSAGDIVMMTAAVRDLHRCYPRRFKTDVRTSCPDLWLNNPFITPSEESNPAVEVINCSYPLINQCDAKPYHCLHGYIDFLNKRLGLSIKPTAFHGDIHLSELEKSWYSQVHELTRKSIPFWVVVAGGKYDVTVKWWDTRRFQAVIDHFRGKIQFVQVGEYGHHHPRLRGVIDLRGQTSLRELVRLVYHSQGVLCPVTAVMHLAAAVPFKHHPGAPRPCVVIAGGREPAHWEAYPGHQYIHTNGALWCCKHAGCWKDRVHPLGDGSPRDHKDLCLNVMDDLPHCMAMISPAEVIRRIELYFDGGSLRYLKPHEARAAKRGIHASRNNSFDDQPLTLTTARKACEEFISDIPPYPGGFGGRGIVICGGGLKYFPCAWVCINMLRQLRCSLPIQLWYLGEDEMDSRMKALLKPLNVKCIDALALRKKHPARRLAGWELKAYCILHSPFREIILLDADNVPLVNPEVLFDCEPYRKTGAIFWPDYGQFKKTQVIWDNCGLERPGGPEFESGQIVIDKKRCWRPLCLAMWFNEHSDFYYQYLLGDKETFHIAFRKLGKTFAMPKKPIHSLYGTMCQHDFNGQRIFQHRNRDKWNLFLLNAKVDGFRSEEQCRAFLRTLQSLWDGRASRYIRKTAIARLAAKDSIQLAASIISCPGREKLRESTLRSFRKSGWGDRDIHVQLDQWPKFKTRQESQTHTSWLALRHLLAKTKADYFLFLEDDLEINRFFYSNILAWAPLRERRTTLAGFYNPGVRILASDLGRHAVIVDPESVYGSQCFLIERTTAAYIVKHWDEIEGMQDIKISRLAARRKRPIFYHMPSLVQHVGKKSTWGGHLHRASDYNAYWRPISETNAVAKPP